MSPTLQAPHTDPSTPTGEDVTAAHDAISTARRRAALARLAELARILALRAPIHALVIEYSGSGDEGQHDEIYAIDAERNLLDMEIPVSAAEQFDAFIPDSYQDGLGGYGTATYLVARQRVVIEHNDYVLASEDHTYAFSADGSVEKTDPQLEVAA